MASCDANTVLSTVIGFSLFILSEVLPFMNIAPNGILDAISRVIKQEYNKRHPLPAENQQRPTQDAHTVVDIV